MSLLDGLIAHWKMEEDGTADRVDSVGIYDLPYHNGAVDRIAGKHNYAVAFNNASANNYLRRNSLEESFYPESAGEFTIALWCYRNNNWNHTGINSVGSFWIFDGVSISPLTIYTHWSDTYSKYIHRILAMLSTGDMVSLDVDSGLQQWDFVVVRWNGSQLSISVNDGTPVTDTYGSIRAWSALSAPSFRVGYRDDLDAQFYVDTLSYWHRALSDAEVTQLYNSGYGLEYPFDLTGGLVSHWKLDEAAGAIRVDSHSSHHLTQDGTVNQVTGKIGYAASFGSGDTYAMGTTVELPESDFPVSGYTIAGWVQRKNAYALTEGGALFRLTSTTPSHYVILLVENYSGTHRARLTHKDASLSTVNVYETGTEITQDNWFFLAARWTGSKIQIRVNNGSWYETAAASMFAFEADAENLQIGNRDFGNAHYVDAMSFWTRALSDAEIDEIYNAGAGLDYPFEAIAGGLPIGTKGFLPLFAR